MIKKINFLQIVLHLIATWVIVFSLYSFSGLYNIRILEIAQQNGVEKAAHNAIKYGITPVDFAYFSLAKALSIPAGILIGLAISIIISIKKKWSLINCLLMFLLSVLISKLDLLKPVMREIISPENISYNLRYKYITQGVLFLVIVMFLFGLKKINTIIEEQIKRETY